MSDTSLRLENQLCFALYTASHAIARSHRMHLTRLGLTYPQYLVLLALLQQPIITSGALARALQLDAGTLTPLVKRLAAAGFVTRIRRVDDERIVDILLTEEGQMLHDALARTRADVVWQSGLDDTSFNALRAALHVLTANLTENTPVTMDAAQPSFVSPS